MSHQDRFIELLRGTFILESLIRLNYQFSVFCSKRIFRYGGISHVQIFRGLAALEPPKMGGKGGLHGSNFFFFSMLYHGYSSCSSCGSETSETCCESFSNNINNTIYLAKKSIYIIKTSKKKKNNIFSRLCLIKIVLLIFCEVWTMQLFVLKREIKCTRRNDNY